jgi:PAS domain S-box-containing protein
MREQEKTVLQLIEEVVAYRQRLADIEELAHLGSWSWTVATGVVEWSDEIYRIFGVTREDFAPNIDRVMSLFHPEDRRLSETILANASQGPGGFTFNARIVRPDGEIRHAISTAGGHFAADGKLERISGTIQDITDRKRAESDLARICEMSLDLICVAGASGYFKYVNPAWHRTLGYTETELLSRPFIEFIHPDDHGKNDDEVASLLSGRKTVGFENRYLHKNGSVRIISWSATSMVNRRLLYCIGRDVTEQKKAEERLKESEHRFALVVDGLNDGLVDWNIMTNKVYYSQQWKEMLGFADHEIGDSHKIWEERFHPEDAEPIWEAIQEYLRGETTELRLEHRLRHEDGSYRWFLARGICVRDEEANPARLVVSHSEITDQVVMRTEQKRLQEQLQQSQKLESIGRLAGGVAHDFNNLLTVIQGYSEMVFESLDVTDPLRQDMIQVQNAVDSAASLTQQLLAFSRKQLVTPKLIDLNRTVSTAEKMIRRIIGENIDLTFKPGADLWQTKVDPGQVDQIIVNLAVNARDAMPGTGSLTLETSNVTLNEPCCHFCLGPVSGDHVRLAVIDSGVGMEKEMLDKIFEPFFTTKGVGKGTGLGLSTITGIVHQANGHIMVRSTPGQGTAFVIHFPRAGNEDMEPQPEEATAATSGSETCLMVEDQEMVRDLAVRALRGQGYTVLEAESGIRALEAADKYADEIDLLITDVVLPGMNGKQLFERIRQLKPDLKVLYMSGYTENAIAHHGVLEPGANFLQKPFRPQELARRVRKILDTELPQSG